MKREFECLVNCKNLYQLQVKNITVEFKYSDSGKKIYECIINVLKRKIN